MISAFWTPCRLGCGAAFGTTYPIDRQMTADLLGFTGISQNSIDGVSDRDYALELTSALSIFMMHLSRFSEEVILWCSWEFKFMELDDAFCYRFVYHAAEKEPGYHRADPRARPAGSTAT